MGKRNGNEGQALLAGEDRPPPTLPARGEAVWAQLMAMLLAMLHWGEIAGGLALLLVILYDIFQSVVLPRPAINKLGTVRYLVRAIWWTWRWVGNRMSSIPRRERWLATYGPISVLSFFIAWGAGLVLGYGLVIDGLRDELRPVPDSIGT